jgi:hypothetical protein
MHRIIPQGNYTGTKNSQFNPQPQDTEQPKGLEADKDEKDIKVIDIKESGWKNAYDSIKSQDSVMVTKYNLAPQDFDELRNSMFDSVLSVNNATIILSTVNKYFPDAGFELITDGTYDNTKPVQEINFKLNRTITDQLRHKKINEYSASEIATLIMCEFIRDIKSYVEFTKNEKKTSDSKFQASQFYHNPTFSRHSSISNDYERLEIDLPQLKDDGSFIDIDYDGLSEVTLKEVSDTSEVEANLKPTITQENTSGNHFGDILKATDNSDYKKCKAEIFENLKKSFKSHEQRNFFAFKDNNFISRNFFTVHNKFNIQGNQIPMAKEQLRKIKFIDMCNTLYADITKVFFDEFAKFINL